MILYNVTISIDPEIMDEWIQWMKGVHIPEVLATGLFIEHRFFRVASGEPGECTFAIQYYLKDLSSYERYMDEFAPDLQKKHTERYKDRFVAIRTILEAV